MVDFIITDFSNVRGGGNIVDSVPSAEDFIVDNCTISSSSSGVFVLTPGESLVGTVSLSANKTSITVGESVVFTATVEDTDGEPLEDLTVSFYRDGVSLGSGVSDDSGMVQLTVSSWSVGSFTCTASCQGVSSSGVTVTVSKVASTISLSAVSSTISVGDSPQLTGTLSVGSGESVKIYLGDVLVDTVTTGTNGAFSFTGSATSTSGSLTFKAVYDGDSTHSSVTSSNVVITVSGSTPVVTSVSLSSDKSVLSAYDSESAVLSATVLDQSSNPMSGETVTFYKGSTSIGTATTNSSGIATKSYSATGAGDVTFKATSSNIESSTLTVEDCIFYDPCTSNAKASAWTIPSGVTSQYSSDGWRISANAYKQIKLTEKLTSACSVEFTLVDYGTTSSSYPSVIIYQYTDGDTTPNQELFLSNSNSSMKVLGNTISHKPVKGAVYKIEYDSTMKIYENGTLLASASNTVGLPTKFEWHQGSGSGRYAVYKDVKVKPIQ